jgi:hypothetical protein
VLFRCGRARHFLRIHSNPLTTILVILTNIMYSTLSERKVSGQVVLKSFGKGTKASTKNGEPTRKGLDEATVYTTAYGTQYVLPVDAMFSRAELLELLEEARETARAEKEGDK